MLMHQLFIYKTLLHTQNLTNYSIAAQKKNPINYIYIIFVLIYLYVNCHNNNLPTRWYNFVLIEVVILDNLHE